MYLMKLEPGCGVVATTNPRRMRVSRGLSTGACQHPFLSTLTREIGMHGGAGVSTDSVQFARRDYQHRCYLAQRAATRSPGDG